ncbi:MAG: phage capsid protein [Kiloniellales bacterium]
MTEQITNAFIKEFQANVHTAYQRKGSKLRETVRRKDDVKGASTVFHKVGKGTASTKARHGKVPTMSVSHDPVECLLADYYAGDWVDRLDELKTNVPEQKVLADAGAYALGRKTDELIVGALDLSTNYALDDTDGLTKAKILAAYELLGEADVPDDGERFAAVGWKQWSELLDINEFKNADYVGPEELPWKGTEAKRWLGTLWIPHSGLTKAGSVRFCHWYHKTAVGHASGAEVKTDISWHGDRAAHFVNSSMSQGAVLVDATGIVTLRCLEA